jgi:hypothetical protein
VCTCQIHRHRHTTCSSLCSFTNTFHSQSQTQTLTCPRYKISCQPTSLLHPNTYLAKMSSAAAQKRLLVEYKNLTNDPPDGITAGPTNEDDMFIWEALIQGPEGTPFEGGIFPAELKFPKDYPLAPPTMRFLCELWHPNGMFEGFFF